MRCQLLPVHSRIADPKLLAPHPRLAERLPKAFHLSQHQIETYEALINPNFDIVVNTSITGDGKSLAGQLPLLVDQRPMMALYPTNELILDQYRNARLQFPSWGRSKADIGTVYGSRLDELAEEFEYGRRGDHLLGQLKNHQLMLSNPDILHAILQFWYRQGRAPDHIAGQIAQLFNQLTFDEFHIFDVPQVAAVLTGLIFLHEQKGNYPLKALFLSATPGDSLIPLLDKAGFRDRVKIINGQYSYDASVDLSKWRPILQPATLNLAPQPIEDWIYAHFEDTVLTFFLRHGKKAKGAIIVNSVATAHRLHAWLKPRMQQHGLTVLPNTGLTERSQRRESYAADLLIGTSTVDIGVDFRINFLIFEANDAGTFLQRLGRLGRHAGYTTSEGAEHTFDIFEAYALLPGFIFERLTIGRKDSPARLIEGQALRRDELQEYVRAEFPPPARYSHYLACWGRFQPMQVIRKLSEPTVRATYSNLVGRLSSRYEQLFQVPMKKTVGMALALNREGQGELVDEARSFRGGSPFESGVLVAGQQEPMSYNFLWLLANAEMEKMSQEEFCAEAERRGFSRSAFARGYHVAFFRTFGWRTERLPILIDLRYATQIEWGPDKASKAQVIRGLRIDSQGIPWLTQFNQQIVRRGIVVLIQPGLQPLDMRLQTYIPGNFPLYSYSGNGQDGTIAFGRQALVLDTILRRKRLRGTPDDPFML